MLFTSNQFFHCSFRHILEHGRSNLRKGQLTGSRVGIDRQETSFTGGAQSGLDKVFSPHPRTMKEVLIYIPTVFERLSKPLSIPQSKKPLLLELSSEGFPEEQNPLAPRILQTPNMPELD